MLGDLGRKRELADGSRGLQVERLEIDGLRSRRADHLDDARERLTLGQIARPRFVHEGAEGVVDLHRVDAQVNVRGSEPRRLQEARQRGDRALGLPARCRGDERVEERGQRLGRDEVVALRPRDDVRGLGKREAAGPHLVERRDLLVDRGDRQIELARDLPRQTLHLRAIAERGLERQKAVANVVQGRLLLLDAHQKREGPPDVVAPVDVVADPGGDGGKVRFQLERLVAER